MIPQNMSCSVTLDQKKLFARVVHLQVQAFSCQHETVDFPTTFL